MKQGRKRQNRFSFASDKFDFSSIRRSGEHFKSIQ